MREEDRTGEESAGEARKGEEMRVQERKGEERRVYVERRGEYMWRGEKSIGDERRGRRVRYRRIEESTRETSICKERREECRREEYANGEMSRAVKL